jgi:hypothetical protein
VVVQKVRKLSLLKEVKAEEEGRAIEVLVVIEEKAIGVPVETEVSN